MSEIIAVALASMQRDMSQVDRVAHNLANVSTPGYKREVAAGRAFSEAMEAAERSTSPVATVPPAGGEVLRVALDGRPGTLRMTGQPLDLALEGEGYFEVSTDAGPAYTRQGTFRLDARGRLVTADGFPVMGEDGEIALMTRAPAIDAAGRIAEREVAGAATGAAARLKVVSFGAGAALRHAGNGFVEADVAPAVLPESRVQVRQGALENANVEPAREMVQLMESVRHFESMQKVVQGYDELLSTAIRKLGDLA